MRSISLPLALCIAVAGCGGHENRQTPAESAAAESAAAMPADTTSVQGTDSVALPRDSAAVRDSTRARGTPTMRKPRTTTRSDTASASQQQSKADSDSTRRFKKPEIRPVYPPIDRKDTSRDSSARRDTSAQTGPAERA